MDKQLVMTANAPAPVGPYSQAIAAGGFVFCSGQIPLDPKTGALLDGSIEAQTKLVMDNLKAVLDAAGSSMDNIVKTTIFLTDLGDFAKVNGVYGSYFGGNPPARSTVQVGALPKGARVEVECIAVQ